MGLRSDLHQLLRGILGSINPTWVGNVYFQPPEGLLINYPCIVYKRDWAITNFANNQPYKYAKRYQVTVIDRDPDSVIPEAIAALPMCVFDRFFTVKDLNHDVYNLFF